MNSNRFSFIRSFMAVVGVAAMLSLMLCSCVSQSSVKGKPVKKSFNVSTWKSIDVSSGIDVKYTIGDKQSILVETTSDILEHLIVKVEDGELKLTIKAKSINNMDCNVSITGPALYGIETSSGAVITLENDMTLTGGKLDLEASSGSLINLKSVNVAGIDIEASTGSVIELRHLLTRHLEAETSTGAVITLASGNADYADMSATSGGNINATNLTVNNGETEASSGGAISLKRGSGMIKSDQGVSGDIRIQ